MLNELGITFLNTIRDITPIIVLIAVFQVLIIKRSIPNLKKVVLGFSLVIFGLTFFLMGLEKALFPLGELMAKQLSNPEFILRNYSGSLTDWQPYYWVYIFSAFIIELEKALGLKSLCKRIFIQLMPLMEKESTIHVKDESFV